MTTAKYIKNFEEDDDLDFEEWDEDCKQEEIFDAKISEISAPDDS